MLTAICDLLAGDTALMTLLTGGLHNGAVVQEISRQNTPSTFDANLELKPCALAQYENDVPFGPLRNSSQLFVTIYFYQRFGHGTIQSAQARVYTLLHRQIVQPTDGGRNFQIQHANTLLGMNDQALNAALVMSRYVCYMNR